MPPSASHYIVRMVSDGPLDHRERNEMRRRIEASVSDIPLQDQESTGQGGYALVDDVTVAEADAPEGVIDAIAGVYVQSWPSPRRIGPEDALKVWHAIMAATGGKGLPAQD